MIGDRLKQARLANGLTQDNVAQALGLNRTTYTYYETGRSEPSFDNIRKLAKMYNVKMSWLIGDSDDDEPLAGNGVLKDGSKFKTGNEEDSAAGMALQTDEKMLVLYYRQLTEAQKAKFIKNIISKI